MSVNVARYKIVYYIEVFLWEIDRDSPGSLKKCLLLPGVCYRQVWLYTVVYNCPLVTNRLFVRGLVALFPYLFKWLSSSLFYIDWCILIYIMEYFTSR